MPNIKNSICYEKYDTVTPLMLIHIYYGLKDYINQEKYLCTFRIYLN